MPPDTTKEQPLKVRKKPGRVPTSCAECRRLKLRCDRKVPCEKCVTRGCATICPDGQLVGGRPGNRFILANTEELHDQIDKLNQRVRELENDLKTARAQSQASASVSVTSTSAVQNQSSPTSSSGTHTSPYSNTSSTTSPEVHPEDAPPASEQDDLVDSFGTLTLDRDGSSKFLGNTARSEYLLRILKQPNGVDHQPSRLSQRFFKASPCGDASCEADPAFAQEVINLLPPMSDAVRTVNAYLDHGQFLYRALSREEVYDQLLNVVYQSDGPKSMYYYQALGLFYAILALGSQFDHDCKPESPQPHEYYLIARAALSLYPPNVSATLWSIQATLHLAEFLELNENETTGSAQAWTFVGLAVRFSHSIGLHLNSARWKLPAEEVQKRNRLFWDLFTLDTWTSFNFGRPTAISLDYVDCDLPADEEIINADGQREMSFRMWKYKFARVVHKGMAIAFGAKPPPYSAILDVDRQIRDFAVPEHLKMTSPASVQNAPTHVKLQRWIALASKETVLLNLHRAYFAVALDQSPESLSTHRYVPSVLAAYRSAWRLSQACQLVWAELPQYLSRLSLPWSQLLSAAIVMCLFVTRAPTAKMSQSALFELDAVAALFVQAAPTSTSASNFVESVDSLKMKAHATFDSTQAMDSSTFTPAELDRLGGKTRLLAAPEAPPPAQLPSSSSYYELTMDDLMEPVPFAAGPAGMSPGDMQTSPSSSVGVDMHNPLAVLHPTIAADMRNFDSGGGGLVYGGGASASGMAWNTNTLDVHYAGGQMFEPQPMGAAAATHAASYQLQPPQHLSGFSTMTTAPVLDATWNSFIEQLGF